MKKLVVGVIISAVTIAFVACSKNSGSVGAVALKSSVTALVAADTKVDNAVVTSGYESDIFSLGSGSIATYSTSIGLKSGSIGGGMFNNMFNGFPNFKLHYRGGICPDLTVTTTGQVVISDSKGNSYSKIITVPLVKTGDCKFISKGVIEYKSSSGKFATIDYGDGTCDNKATRTTQDTAMVILLGRIGR